MCCPLAARVLHVLALGLWFGGRAFFNFAVAPAVFASFKDVVATSPSDRTAHQTISQPDTDKDALANALAGSAVGPVFPVYFATQAGCGAVALATALLWWNAGGAVHRWRVVVLALGLATVAAAWPISNTVGDLRPLRFDPNEATASAAKTAFAAWHLASLGLSLVTIGLAGAALAMAAALPGACGVKPAADQAGW